MATIDDGCQYGILVNSCGVKTLVENVFLGQSLEPSMSMGGGIHGVLVRDEEFYGTNIVEDGTFTSAGLTTNLDASDVQIQDNFPSGVGVASDVKMSGAVRITCHIGGVSESTSSNGGGQILNGKSYVTTTPGSGSILDGSEALAHRLNDSIENRPVTAPYNLYKATSDSVWAHIG